MILLPLPVDSVAESAVQEIFPFVKVDRIAS